MKVVQTTTMKVVQTTCFIHIAVFSRNSKIGVNPHFKNRGDLLAKNIVYIKPGPVIIQEIYKAASYMALWPHFSWVCYSTIEIYIPRERCFIGDMYYSFLWHDLSALFTETNIFIYSYKSWSQDPSKPTKLQYCFCFNFHWNKCMQWLVNLQWLVKNHRKKSLINGYLPIPKYL
jgi:hypothetical protein